MSNANINNTKFYYELHGEGQPLVLIAGLKADHTAWLTVLDQLASRYKVLIFDNRGAGRTEDSGECFNVETMADDVMQLVQGLKLTKPHIVGHSLGGAIGQVIARKHPEKISSLVLSNTFIKFNDTGRAAFSHTLKLYQDGESPSCIMKSVIPWVFSEDFLNPEIIATILKASSENPYPQSLRGYERQLQALYEFNSKQWINTIKVPTLVIGSDHDKVATLIESQELASKISGAKLKSLPTGHASQVENADMFVNILNDFYNELLI